MGLNPGWLAVAEERGLVRVGAGEVRAPAPPPPAGCSEARFQAAVVALAERSGWAWFHVYNSRRCPPGFPDLVLVRPPVLILAELKTDTGRVTRPQADWLELLGRVPGVRVRLWRPALWAAVAAELTEGGGEQ